MNENIPDSAIFQTVQEEDYSFDFDKIDIWALGTPTDYFNCMSAVKGSATAKKHLASLIYLAKLKTIAFKKELDTSKMPKLNMLLVGETGTGKTYLLDCVGKALNIPITYVDASNTQRFGYSKGKSALWWYEEHATNCLNWLRKNNIAKTTDNFDLAIKRGILFVDEIDKLAQKPDANDDHSRAIQDNILSLLHGRMITEKHLDTYSGDGTNAPRTMFNYNTADITVIFAGAFSGILDIVRHRTSKSHGMGFGGKLVDKTVSAELITKKDIEQYGIKAELLGRIKTIASTEKPTIETLKEILIGDESPIVQYSNILKIDDIELVFTEKAVTAAAEKAHNSLTNVRELLSIVEESVLRKLQDFDHNEDKNRLVITEKDIVSSDISSAQIDSASAKDI